MEIINLLNSDDEEETLTLSKSNPEIKDEEIHIPNTASNDEDFRWHKYGTKDVIAEDKKSYKKIYWVCAEHQHGCQAKKSLHDIPGNARVVYKGEHHNHKPSQPRVRLEVKEKVINQLQTGSKPSAIHKQLVIYSPETSRKQVPSFSK